MFESRRGYSTYVNSVTPGTRPRNVVWRAAKLTGDSMRQGRFDDPSLPGVGGIRPSRTGYQKNTCNCG
ncbi:hypothetical protein [Maioricimonas rarisocia]|uniref:hypothetical protein n=1 Tax=Maioricimonas rarisocia TaxID=2528026 RepID=UPI0011A785BF|nr:hypothetical protein [Maioricimonas rarisocia]